ncbi:MAG: hypothetical protein KDE27_31320, partial [Planctomycetes bacterium]|nr:hypothetical protein [Planctomycetota bacterium]
DGVDVDVAGAGVALDVQNAAAVLVQNSVCRGRHGLQLQDALLATSAVDWLGRGGTGGQVGYGIVATRGTIDLSLGSCEGTRGPAIRIGDSAIRMAGNGATGLRVGGTAAGQVAAFAAVLSDARWPSSRFGLQPQNGAPGFAAVGGTVTTEDVPALAATGAAPGGQLSVTASRPAPAPGAIVLGHLAARHIAFGVDAVWLDEFGPAFVIAVGAVDANGLTRQVTWPNVPWLLGEVFGCQGLVLPSGGGSLATAPAVWAAM